jgi:hypothetical protein
MKDQDLSQLAWECGFHDQDMLKLYKFAGPIRADAFSSGFESGMRFQRQISVNILKQALQQIGGKES